MEYLIHRLRRELFECLANFDWVLSDDPRDYGIPWPLCKDLITPDDLTGWIVAVTGRRVLDRFVIPGAATLSCLPMLEEYLESDKNMSIVRAWGTAIWPVWGVCPHTDQKLLAEMVLAVLRAEISAALWRTLAQINADRAIMSAWNVPADLNLSHSISANALNKVRNAETA